jgi:hypothetical protein
MGRDMAWLGRLKIRTNFKKFTPFVTILVPQERVKILNYAYIDQEPVYFDLSLPRDFKKVILQFNFRNDSNNLIEIGAQTKDGWELKPLDNKILNQLTWSRLAGPNLVLYQRVNKYETISDFLDNLPDIKEIATYNYNLAYDYQMADYQANNNLSVFKQTLVDSYRFYTYLKDEDLYFDFSVADGFLPIDSKNTLVNVYNLNNDLLGTFYPENHIISVRMANLLPGAYMLEFKTEVGAETRQIITKQQYLSFVNNLNLWSPAKLVTDSKTLTFMTDKNEGLQTVTLDGEQLKIENIWEQYKTKPQYGLQEFNVPKGQMQITGDGLLAYGKKQFFNPLINKITQATDLDAEKINYIIAEYNLPQVQNDFKINSVEFNLSDKQIKDGKLRFVISIPGLMASGQGVLIKDLQITALRLPIFMGNLSDNFKEYFKLYNNAVE